MIKAVNDTNVWVAGIHWNKGAGYLIRQRWAAGEFQHLTSSEILSEMSGCGGCCPAVFEHSTAA